MAYKTTQIRKQGRTATGPKRKKASFTPAGHKKAATKTRLNKLRNERLKRDANPKKYTAKKVKSAVKKYDKKKAAGKKANVKRRKALVKENKAYFKAKAKTGVGYKQFKKDTAPKPKKVRKLSSSAKKRLSKAFGGKKTVAKAKAKPKYKYTGWKAATSSAKKSGTSMSALISERKKHKKGTAAYAKVQNKINKHSGSKVRHTIPKLRKPLIKTSSSSPAKKQAKKVPKKVVKSSKVGKKAYARMSSLGKKKYTFLKGQN